MKKMMISWLLPIVIDMAIQALQSLAHKSDNNVDDMMVATLIQNKDKLIDEVKTSL